MNLPEISSCNDCRQPGQLQNAVGHLAARHAEITKRGIENMLAADDTLAGDFRMQQAGACFAAAEAIENAFAAGAMSCSGPSCVPCPRYGRVVISLEQAAIHQSGVAH